MHPEQQALERAILADPHNDAPRMALADWLMERHEEGSEEWQRGQFIRLSFERGRFETRGTIGGLDQFEVPAEYRYRWRELLDGSQTEFVTIDFTFPMPLAGLAIERGFPEFVHCPWGAWEAHGREVLRRYPIRHVHFVQGPPVRVTTRRSDLLASKDYLILATYRVAARGYHEVSEQHVFDVRDRRFKRDVERRIRHQLIAELCRQCWPGPLPDDPIRFTWPDDRTEGETPQAPE